MEAHRLPRAGQLPPETGLGFRACGPRRGDWADPRSAVPAKALSRVASLPLSVSPCPMLSHAGQLCPSTSLASHTVRQCSTLSMLHPLASARRPPGARGPAARRGSTGLGPGVLRHPGGGDGSWTGLHAPNPAPPGPGNNGKPRATLGTPLAGRGRAARTHSASGF